MTKVLILEDKWQSREVLVRMVEEIDAGSALFAVANEDEAYAIAMKRSIDVFLVDIILHPERTGDSRGLSLHVTFEMWKSIILRRSFSFLPCMMPRCVCSVRSSAMAL